VVRAEFLDRTNRATKALATLRRQKLDIHKMRNNSVSAGQDQRFVMCRKSSCVKPWRCGWTVDFGEEFGNAAVTRHVRAVRELPRSFATGHVNIVKSHPKNDGWLLEDTGWDPIMAVACIS
jgi:hypothetical protein